LLTSAGHEKNISPELGVNIHPDQQLVSRTVTVKGKNTHRVAFRDPGGGGLSGRSEAWSNCFIDAM